MLVAVAGMPYKCPPAPFEMAMVLDWDFRRRGLRSGIEIDVFTPEPAPLVVAGPDAGAGLVAEMGGRDIRVHTGAGIAEVAASSREAAFSDGTSMDADLVVTVPTHGVPPLVDAAGLVGPSGWVYANLETLETQVPDVYAIGDVSMVPMANGRGLPKAGVFASAQGETVGHNIAAGVNNTERAVFPGVGHCFILYGGLVSGEFLSKGKPKVSLEPPSAEGFAAKVQFEEDWRRFRI